MIKKTVITMLALTALMSVSAMTLFEARFDEVSGTSINHTDSVVGAPFQGACAKYGRTDGKGNLVWNRMCQKHYSAYASMIDKYTSEDAVILRLETRISDFDFSPETKFSAQLRFYLSDGPNGVYMALHVGGPGQQLLLRSRGFEQDEFGHENQLCFSRASQLSMYQVGISSLNLRLEADLRANTYDLFWRQDGQDWIQVGDELPLGLGGAGSDFYEIDRVRIGTGGSFKEGSSVSIDWIKAEEVVIDEPTKTLGFLCTITQM